MSYADIVVNDKKQEDQLRQEVHRLAQLSILAYDQEKGAAAKKCGLAQTTLDKLVKDQRLINRVFDGKSAPLWWHSLDRHHGFNTIHNVQIVLSECSTFAGKLRFNEFANAIDARELPWWPKEKKKQGWQHWGEVDAIGLAAWFQEKGMAGVVPNTCIDAAILTAHKNVYHPVREWLGNLPPWDGIPRLDTFPETYLRTPAVKPIFDTAI